MKLEVGSQDERRQALFPPRLFISSRLKLVAAKRLLVIGRELLDSDCSTGGIQSWYFAIVLAMSGDQSSLVFQITAPFNCQLVLELNTTSWSHNVALER